MPPTNASPQAAERLAAATGLEKRAVFRRGLPRRRDAGLPVIEGRALTARRIAFVLRLFLGGLLVYASHDKLFDPQPFANAVDNYQILPYSLVNLAAIVLPWIEMVTGLCLIAGVFAPGAGLVATGMFAVFTVALVSAVLRGLNINCGCFSLEEGAEKVSWLAAGDARF